MPEQGGTREHRSVSRLRRAIGVVGLTAYGVGTILGAGIYTLIGPAAGLAGDGLWLAFALAAGIAALTGLSYAELATTYPTAGAEFQFVRCAFGSERLAFLVGWILVISGTASISTVALGFAGYLPVLRGVPDAVIAFALVAMLTAVNLVGIRASTAVNIVFTLIEAGGLVLVIVAGISARGLALPSVPAASWPGIVEAAAFIFFAYLGFEDIANVAEETVAPERFIPIAIGVSVGLTALLYIGVALAALALIPPARLAASPAPLADALAVAWGTPGRQVLAAIALFATANTVLLLMIASTRMLYAMARSGTLPSALGRVEPATGTPAIAIVVQGLAAVVLLPLGGIAILGSLASWAALVAFVSVNASLLWLRRTQPELPRPFRVPFSLGWVSLPALLGLLAALLASLRFAPQVLLAGLIAALLGLLVYEMTQRSGR